MSINKHILIGNVGKDPEVRIISETTKVAKFSLATTEVYKKNGEKKEETSWHQIVIWNKLAEIVEKYVKKGSKLYLEGKVTYRNYDDKDGVKHYVTEIVCNQMQMLSKPQSDEIDITQIENGIDQDGEVSF